MKLGTIKVFLSSQINEVGPVIGNIFKKFNYEATKIGGYFYFVSFQRFFVVEKEINGVIICKFEFFFFLDY